MNDENHTDTQQAGESAVVAGIHAAARLTRELEADNARLRSALTVEQEARLRAEDMAKRKHRDDATQIVALMHERDDAKQEAGMHRHSVGNVECDLVGASERIVELEAELTEARKRIEGLDCAIEDVCQVCLLPEDTPPGDVAAYVKRVGETWGDRERVSRKRIEELEAELASEQGARGRTADNLTEAHKRRLKLEQELTRTRTLRDELTSVLTNVREERDECRREMKHACVALADEYVPVEERAGAHLQGLPRLVAHAVEHHQWHHDAQDSEYVKRVEIERDEARKRIEELEQQLDGTEKTAAGYLDLLERVRVATGMGMRAPAVFEVERWAEERSRYKLLVEAATHVCMTWDRPAGIGRVGHSIGMLNDALRAAPSTSTWEPPAESEDCGSEVGAESNPDESEPPEGHEVKYRHGWSGEGWSGSCKMGAVSFRYWPTREQSVADCWRHKRAMEAESSSNHQATPEEPLLVSQELREVMRRIAREEAERVFDGHTHMVHKIQSRTSGPTRKEPQS